MGEMPIGKVTHYFAKIGVGVIELDGELSVGEKILVKRSEGSFEQKVESMQIEHKSISKAEAGQSIGLKLVQPAHEGNAVFKITPE
ncbi:MAG: translation elongation factor-like protein [Candidatus Micrarchaeota archaeon]